MRWNHLSLALAALAAFAVTTSPTAAAVELLQPGDPFPGWALQNDTGAVTTADSLKGKTYLLWFFPKAQTPGCTAEGRALRDRYADFQSRGVEIVGVSFDLPEQNAAFVAAEGFPFRLLSDNDRLLAGAVGAADSETQPTPKRISYLVGPDGIVIKSYASVDPAEHAAEVLRDLPAPKGG